VCVCVRVCVTFIFVTRIIIIIVRTYYVDELYHGQPELDGDCFAEVAYWSNERIVAIVLEQRVDQLHLVLATQPYTRRVTQQGPNAGCSHAAEYIGGSDVTESMVTIRSPF